MIVLPIKVIAREVREVVEAEANMHNHPRDLEGYCANASLILDFLLRKYGHKSMFVEGHFVKRRPGPRSPQHLQHCWVEVNDYVVDVTATQFDSNLPPVYIAKGADLKSYKATMRGLAASHFVRREWDMWILWSEHAKLQRNASARLKALEGRKIADERAQEMRVRGAPAGSRLPCMPRDRTHSARVA